MASTCEIGFVGTGQMGEALIRGIIEAGFCNADQILANDIRKDLLDEMMQKYGINVASENPELANRCNTVILAVKPQDIPDVLSEISPYMGERHLIISIAAGIPLRFLEARLNKGVHVIRIMPNTPSLLRLGCSALSPGSHATRADLDHTSAIFKAVGEVVEVDEKLMDAVTAVSGNGPAYVYLFVEALIDAGIRMGLSRHVAKKLVLHSVKGATEMLLVTGEHPAVLKEQVTSPGGTAMAALAELERGAFRSILLQAVEAGTMRSKALGEAVG
jgi:pyrroline-5-carboxylate reductase